MLIVAQFHNLVVSVLSDVIKSGLSALDMVDAVVIASEVYSCVSGTIYR